MAIFVLLLFQKVTANRQFSFCSSSLSSSFVRIYCVPLWVYFSSLAWNAIKTILNKISGVFTPSWIALISKHLRSFRPSVIPDFHHLYLMKSSCFGLVISIQMWFLLFPLLKSSFVLDFRCRGRFNIVLCVCCWTENFHLHINPTLLAMNGAIHRAAIMTSLQLLIRPKSTEPVCFGRLSESEV